MKNHEGNIIKADISGDFKNFRNAVKSFALQTQADDIFHFVGDHPLLSLKRKQIFSITQSSLKNLNRFGRLGQLGGVYYSDRIDVLDPAVFKKLRQLFFYKRGKIHQTSNSFCDTELFYALPFEQKKNWMVFLGRFEPMKQVISLLDAVPSIHSELQKKGVQDDHFYFFFYFYLEEEMKQMLVA